jgi:hypothetical protein
MGGSQARQALAHGKAKITISPLRRNISPAAALYQNDMDGETGLNNYVNYNINTRPEGTAYEPFHPLNFVTSV